MDRGLCDRLKMCSFSNWNRSDGQVIIYLGGQVILEQMRQVDRYKKYFKVDLWPLTCVDCFTFFYAILRGLTARLKVKY